VCGLLEENRLQYHMIRVVEGKPARVMRDAVTAV